MEIVLTSYRREEKELLKQLRGLGDFYQTGFRDVIKGRVEDLEGFLVELEERSVFSLSRVVPIERSFDFSLESVVEEFCEAARSLVEGIERGESFSVIVERRGLKGAFSSQQVAREVGAFLSEFLEERDGERPRVNLSDPDKAVIFETLGRWCGVGIIPRGMREKYFYMKLP